MGSGKIDMAKFRGCVADGLDSDALAEIFKIARGTAARLRGRVLSEGNPAAEEDESEPESFDLTVTVKTSTLNSIIESASFDELVGAVTSCNIQMKAEIAANVLQTRIEALAVKQDEPKPPFINIEAEAEA